MRTHKEDWWIDGPFECGNCDTEITDNELIEPSGLDAVKVECPECGGTSHKRRMNFGAESSGTGMN